MVHHQHTNKVALSSWKERAGGGVEYIDMFARGCYVSASATPVYLRRGDERGCDDLRLECDCSLSREG